MDWEELSPLTDAETQCISELEQMMTRLCPLAQDIDKSKVEVVEPSELSTLPATHKLRNRYTAIQSQRKSSDAKLNKQQPQHEDEDDDAYRFSRKLPPFDYVDYFVSQMTQHRHVDIQLSARQQQGWNFLIEKTNCMKRVLFSIAELDNVLTQLSTIYSANQTQCQRIHHKCQNLVEEQKELEMEAQRLRTMVQYFSDYHPLRTRVHATAAAADTLNVVLSTEYHQVVTRINECIAFFAQHKELKESVQYLQNYQLLRGKCMHSIRQCIHDRLQKAEHDSRSSVVTATATTTTGAQSDESQQPQQSQPQLVVVSILEYRAAALRLRPLLRLIESEAHHSSEFAALLNEIQRMVLQARQSQLKQCVHTTIDEYSSTRDTPNLIRASCSYVMMICVREYKLFADFFDLDLTLQPQLSTTRTTMPSSGVKRRRLRRRQRQSMRSSSASVSSAASGGGMSVRSTSPDFKLSVDSNDVADDDDDDDDDANIICGAKRINALIKDLCVLLYSYLRPFIIQTSSMQVLCDVIHILQNEIQEHMQLRFKSSRRITDNDDEDVNEEEEEEDAFESHIPEFDGTIVRIIEDAQERLVFRTQICLRDEIQNYAIGDADLNYYAVLQNIYQNQNQNQNTKFSDWSPVLENTLDILSKIYPVLTHSVFEFLAYEAVSCCVATLVEIARKLSHRTSSIHGHLFLVKHLLVLREQISPFDVDFSITETTLEFDHMTQYLSELVSKTTTMTGGYSLVQVIQHTIPTVSKHQLNSKKSMESVLKKCCETFIETQTNLLIGPLIALIAKYKQQSAIAKLRQQHREKQRKIHPLQKEEQEQKDDEEKKEEKDDGNVSVSASVSMSHDERQRILSELNAVLESFEHGLPSKVDALMQCMQLYLQNELTQRILLKPIISNMQTAFLQLRKIVIETDSQSAVKLSICDAISDHLQHIVQQTDR